MSHHDDGDVDWEEESGGCKDCQLFNSCHTNWQDDVCDVYHWNCASLSAAMVLELKEAVRKLSAEDLARLVARGSGRLRIEIERGVVQVLDCAGAVFAQEQVTPSVLRTSRQLLNRGG